MKRRKVLKLGGFVILVSLVIFGSLLADIRSARGQQVEEAQTHILRIYADAEGNSHLEELPIVTMPSGQRREALRVAATGMMISEYKPRYVNDWHTAPTHQFAITIVGELEVEVSDGVKRRVHTGELVFLEDTKGKGHITRILDRATNLFIAVPDNFDVVSWAKGKD
jgi:quercetin dioxygenase-like cupin family protein